LIQDCKARSQEYSAKIETSHQSSEKGRALERAVKFIQEKILSDPKFNSAKFSVESNQIVTVRGTRHEIDVLVKMFVGSLYESSWVFECKNWKKPVGKNEVMILAGKVNAIGAARGYLVARKITKDARAFIEQDSRLQFCECTDDFQSPFCFSLIHIIHDYLPISLSIKIRRVPPGEHPKQIEWKDKKCLLDGKPVDFQEFISKHVKDIVAHDRRENEVRYRYEGTHYSTQRWEFIFKDRELLLGDLDIEQMTMAIMFFVTVETTKSSQFEMKGQGRVFSLDAMIDDGGQRLEIDIFQKV
jgi:hypothetical protein